MKRALPAFWLVVLLTVPLWLHDQYILHILITTGIFIIAAMSLNLLLGYTGQLSLGHVAFFGIGAYASALTTLGFNVELPGGLGNITGATLGGFILAFVEEIGAGYISSGYRDAMGFLIIILVLLFKPTGLFARAERIG